MFIVHTLLYADVVADVLTIPDFIQLMDDDIVSLTALTLIANPECRGDSPNIAITQLTLSLYLITQCQLKLHHSMTSLAQTLDYIEVAQRRCPVDWTLDHLTLKLTERKIMIYLSEIMFDFELICAGQTVAVFLTDIIYVHKNYFSDELETRYSGR